MKTCFKCNLEKSLDYFFNDKKRNDGKYPTCKECTKIYSNSRKIQKKEYDKKYRELNKENRKQQILMWIKNNPDKRKQIERKYHSSEKGKLKDRERQKRFRLNNSQKIKAIYKKSYYKHHSKRKLEHREWMKKNFKKVLAYNSSKKRKLDRLLHLGHEKDQL